MSAAPASGPFPICLALLLVLTGAASLSGLDDVEAVAERDSTLPDCHADGGCGAEDEQPAALVELLQMGLQISGLAKAEVKSSAVAEAALQVNSSAVAEAAFQVNRSIPYLGLHKVNTSIPAMSVQKELPACSSVPFHGSQPTPLNLQIQMGFLASLGYEQHRYRSCQEITPLGVTYEVRTPGSAASPTATAPGILQSIPLAIWFFIGYLLIFVLILGRMFYMLLSSSVQQPKNANYRPEATSWKAGFLSWISISWVTPWICRWGSATESASTKIKSQDLGQTSWADMEAANTVDEWDRLWNQDVAKKGTYHTNMYIVVMKFCTIRKLMQLAILTFIFEIIMILGPTILVDQTLRYMEELQLHHLRDGHPTSWEKQAPVVVAVCALYTGIPLAMCLFNTVATLMGTRMYIRLQSALLAAVYKKAQRMPINGHSYDLSEPDDDKAPKMLAGDGAGGMKGKNYSLVQLCNSDINANLMNFQNVLVKIIAEIPILIGICVLMFWKLGLATFIVAGMIIAMSLLIAFLVRQQFIRFGWFQACVGGRLAFFQEVMHSIRMFKSNAFEPAGIQILFDCRMRELEQLSWYYFWMGLVIAAMLAYPKVVALGGLAAFERMHAGRVKAADVFVMIQILNAFKGVCNSLIQVIPQVAGMFPSIQRVDRMLKLKEANLPGDKTQHMDKKWLTLWPEEGPEKPLFLGERQGTDVKPALRCQGSFLWSESGKVALSDIDIQVHQGELVAIMGEVGSGKSTLLAAMLGELYPTRDSRLEIPKRIAYHSQVPVIAEATLKENILYWSEHDEKRYKESIHAACLLPDLQILPGGDMVPIGSRGISLSGGQKARVSLARAAYARDAPVVLIDDPFASVDVPTGRHLMDNLLRGPLMKDRVRVVVCQPDRQRVKVFDRIYIMAEGRIAAAGTPEEVVATPEYQALLSKYEASMLQDELEAGPVANQAGNMENFERTVDTSTANRQQAVALREEEHEGRADSNTIKFFLTLGGYKFLTVGVFLLVGTAVLSLFSDLVLVRWSNQIMQSEILGISLPDGQPFLSGSAIWWAISMGCFGLSWFCGIRFICNISGWVHNLIVDRLFKAPVDRFYDKTPVGRIMNRMSFDMTDIDLQMFWKFQGVLNTIIAYLIPLVYVHIVMPTYLILGSIPFYTLIFVLVSRYWNTMVPLRYLTAISRSQFNSYVTEVDHDTVTSRAYQTFNAVSTKEMEAVDDMIKAEYANICVSRWTTTRVLLTYSVFGTIVAALSVMVLAKQGANVGTVGMCLGHLSFMIMGSEGFLLQLTDAQFQFISMNRLHEYSDLPEEKAQVQENDYKYNSPVVQVSRQHMGSLEVQREGCLLKIVRVKGDGTKELVLEQMPDIQAFQPPDGKTMAILAPENPALHYTAPWHRLHAVDGVAKDAAAMAEVLCQDVPQGMVWLNIRSGWLAGGAKIVLTDLVIGYADLPNNVLNGVNLTIEARSKTAIAGATGCGKSTTILALLRMLEPRGGKVEINGVDLQTIGLLTLRRSMGLVPQDPVLFSGTIRNNIDVFAMYTDNEVWAALRAVQLADFVNKSGVGLDMYVKSDGDNISFGQKQLLCIARQVLRNPELLLLDECTSAIDPHTQELVQDTIRSGFPDSTLVAIAHRLETIMDFDTVIVLDKGRVVERGAISELSHAKNGWFAKMLHAKDRA